MKNIIQNNLFSLIFLNLLALLNLNAQDITIQASVDRNPVAVDQRFIYTVEVSGKSTSLPKPNFPNLQGFSVLSGPNTSTNIQFANGAMSSSHTYSFYLMPQKEGDYVIEAASIEIDGETVSSNTIDIKVIKAAAKPQTQKDQIQSSTDQDALGENLYLKTIVNKKNVYQNEQILVEYKLYFRVDVRSYNIEKIPPNSGFWMEEFKIASQPTVSREIVNGITYQVATLRKIALFPTQSGELTIEPLVIAVDALVKRNRRSRSLFDDFFDDPFGRTVKKSLSSNPVNITVKPHPTAGRLAEFDGMVGNFQISADADVKELKTNEAVSVKLTISGEGNIKLISPPKLKLPPDMEVYAPKEKTDITPKDDKITGSKSVEYVLVPRFKGAYTIEPVSIAYFDPRKEKYVKMSTNPIPLNVLQGEETKTGLLAGSSLSKQEVALLGQDIRYIKETAQYYISGQKLYKNWIYLVCYLFPLIGLAVAWRYQQRQNFLKGNLQMARKQKAGKVASKHLKAAKNQIKSDNTEAFYRATTDALQGFVCDRLNLQIADFNTVGIQKDLENAGLEKEDVEAYLDCLQTSEFNRYSGVQSDLNEMESFYQRVKLIFTRLEKYI